MLRMGKLADYGTVIMTHMAREPVLVLSAQKIALAIGLKLPTVSKILKKLVQGKLISSQRGSRGGYTLARAPGGISVAEIIDTIEGYPMGLTECSNNLGLCSRESICSVRSNWQQISLAIRDVLSGISLIELSRPMPQNIDTTNIGIGSKRRKAAELQEMLVES